MVDSIERIKSLLQRVEEKLDSLKASDFGGQLFGAEREFSAKGVLAGIRAIVLDVGALLKKESQVIKLCSHSERESIGESLERIDIHLDDGDLDSAALELDSFKPMIRSLRARSIGARQSVMEDYLDKIQRHATNIEEINKVAAEKKADFEESCKRISGLIQEFEERREVQDRELGEISSNLEYVREKHREYSQVVDDANEVLSSVSGSVKEVELKKEYIEDFFEKIDQREDSLKSQEALTEKYERGLKEYAKSYNDTIKHADKLIESAKKALEYKTAEGLSAAFSQKHDDAKQDKSTWMWVWSAGAFVVVAIGIGIWLFLESNASGVTVLGRFSLIPIALISAWFCANQHVKQRNIIEDYAYKSVLAKSLVGFSEQLSGDSYQGDAYTHYIKMVLKEMHRDPFRKRGGKEPDDRTEDDLSLLQEKIDHMLGALNGRSGSGE